MDLNWTEVWLKSWGPVYATAAKRKHHATKSLRQTLQCSVSAVAKPNFARKYALESSRRDLQNTQYTHASLGEKNRIENEIMKMYTNKKYSTEKAE